MFKRLITSIKRALYPKRVRLNLLRFVLKGNNVQCPCCKSGFITFLPAGIQKRANAACIKCGSLERHRNLWLFFKENPLLFINRRKLLHVAPEKIFSKFFLAQSSIDYHAVDLEPDAYNYNSKTIAMDLTDLKFAENYFDMIICSHVLEHIPDDAKAIHEMYRVLQQNGWAIINVPVHQEREITFEDITINDPKKQLALFGQPDHVRIYGKDYVQRLQYAGFKVEIIKWPLQYDHNTRFKYGLKENEIIYFCRK